MKERQEEEGRRKINRAESEQKVSEWVNDLAVKEGATHDQK